MSDFITINGRKIGNSFTPYIIAEMSANHNGDINNAYKIIDMTKSSGADCVKLQTYTPDTLTIDSTLSDFQLTEGLWSGQSLYELYKSAFMPWEWHKPLFDYAKKVGITIFSSPFDNTAVDLLEDLNTPAYKIASFEAVDLPLIKYVAQTGKPMIISTGMADTQEIQEAIEAAREGGCKELAILHCVSGYPAPAADYNLRTLADMQGKFGLVTGLSDHTIDNTTAITSVALGASIIEKHVTLDRNGGGPDDSFSLESEELKQLCVGAKTAWESLGQVDYGRKSSEQANVKFRRSLYFVKNIKEGEIITKDHVRSIRPGYGVLPKFLDDILGKKVCCDIESGTAVQFKHL
ncbi:N-acetylneuraminate synthase (EC 2.5.1.56) [uncultured Gammaproteobacteria bacterium]|uniref:pseudaminic acid synthase n=1 Tax=Bathymodiolus heckerae thiotrophic gill symbiont TaxID=1052212 RepID=UPI0010B1EC77|nr:pseudaminic acid synthase [Bathymodiolus heckerae thiotrophic gill symbiont]CAC9545181.1 N-acetylneuraminate synthase (EC 2.5.1.56) [uncultured Gammaproteobacteria bacterium]CAC9597628.1 N-acetylneuraminate synthase (EC 2.5.1.56) [uncultured Gammaproteobacteria bacterium]CAC9959831.1 N-acetylneuraminate synthase (EC 2.5.1.56) [uncultured Gammaproteobacteria bacterium]SHN89651.1 N-acetylneuraminate synthase [Bathymodiolus heckerae thiotrophic gill symbiont]